MVKTTSMKEYLLGREFAEKWFNYYLETGRGNPGGAESMIYCEMVAGEIRNKELITQEQINLVKRLKQNKNTSYYNGVCDFLLEKMKKSSE